MRTLDEKSSNSFTRALINWLLIDY